MAINKEQTFTVSEDVLFQEVSGETVLLDLASESYFGLDEVGTRVWQLLNDGHCLESLLGVMLDEYDVEPERLETDIRALLDSLLEAGLITI